MTIAANKHVLSVAAKKHSVLHSLITRNGPLRVGRRREDPLFDYLARVIISQQLSSAAADAIFGRLQSAARAHGLHLSQLASPEWRERLPSFGISRNKIQAIQHLQTACEFGVLRRFDTASPTHDELRECICSVWGLGTWSADMAAIFYFGLEDVWPTEDAALRRALSSMEACNSSATSAFAAAFAPYRSYLALHVWRGLDNGDIGRSRAKPEPST